MSSEDNGAPFTALEAVQARVVNIRHEPYKSNQSLYVYIGRAGGLYLMGLKP